MDWYIILFLAIILLIFHMQEFGEHRHFSQYFLPHKELRLSQGVILILFHVSSDERTALVYYFRIYLFI